MNKQIERHLLPRLRLMGFILISFSLLAFGYAIFKSPYPPSPPELELDIEQSSLSVSDSPNQLLLNLYAVSAIFAAVGLTCITIASKRKKTQE